MKLYIYNPKTKLFDFFIDALKYEFEKRYFNSVNIDNKLIEDIKDIKEINNKDILFIIINPHFIKDYKEINDEIIELSKRFKYKVFYITEPINYKIEKIVYEGILQMIKPFAIWTYTYENFNKLRLWQPLYNIHPNYNILNTSTISTVHLKNKNIKNIIFIGNITDTRKDICNKFGNKLINYNDSWTKDEWNTILTNNLFYLNIHRRIGCKSFEAFRIIPILANGGVVISERCNEKDEMKYSKFNIKFVERELLYSTFLNILCNINYEDIYNKIILFRNTMKECIEIDNFLEYYNKMIM